MAWQWCWVLFIGRASAVVLELGERTVFGQGSQLTAQKEALAGVWSSPRSLLSCLALGAKKAV